MSESLPQDVQEFVQSAIASGEYGSEDEVVAAGIRALKEMKERHDTLREDVQVAIAELDRGEGQSLDMDAIKRDVAKRHKQKT